MFNNLRNYFFDDNYVINIYEGYFHICNYTKVNHLSDKEVVISINNFKINIKGKDFLVSKMLDNEILIKGSITDMRFIYE